ncbi:MAG: Ig-like domain-containing protein [Planctomycetota bacterium]
MPRPRPHSRFAVLALALLLSGCGGSGNSGSTGGIGNALVPLRLGIVAHTPADRAVQVSIGVIPQIEFDGDLALECLEDSETGLFELPTGTRFEVDFEAVNARTLTVRPRRLLAPATDYELRLSALTCDHDGRLLDAPFTLAFRTTDRAPPRLVAVESAAPLQPRTSPIVVRFDDALDPSSVNATTLRIRDDRGLELAATLTVADDLVTMVPRIDPRGSTELTVIAEGIRDRSGNRLDDASAIELLTESDVTPPRLISAWPALDAEVSPLATLELRFDESIVLPPQESLPQLVAGEEMLAAELQLSSHQRSLLVRPQEPLPPHTVIEYRTTADDILYDVSGNALSSTVLLRFIVGDDDRAPTSQAFFPAHGAAAIDPATDLRVTFDEALDALPLEDLIAEITVDGVAVAVASTSLTDEAHTLRIVLAEELPPSARVDVAIPARSRALRDHAGNAVETDLHFSFTTSADPVPLGILIWPEPNAVGVPFDAQPSILLDAAVDPLSVDDRTIRLRTADGDAVDIALALERFDRVVRVRPLAPLMPGRDYELVVLGGAGGLRKASGNWLREDVVRRFRAGFRTDLDPPVLEVTVAGIESPRNEGRIFAPVGLTFDLRARAGTDPSVDLSTAILELVGPTALGDAESLIRRAEIGPRTLRLRMGEDERLLPGRYVLRGSVRDLSGNLGTAPELAFDVLEPDAATLPFERTQVVWVRFDLDRSANGRSDFDDDLVRLGLLAEGDPVGANERLSRLIRDGALSAAHRVFGRGANGAPLDRNAVPLRLTQRQPLGVLSMQIACGGYDPDGDRTRSFGSASTGILGRARFDLRNAITHEVVAGGSPALGVFPGELYLFESRVHRDVYPGFITTFARHFGPILPELGGEPAGTHPLDAIVLDVDFDPAAARPNELARWSAIMQAADDWAVCVSVILAHEIGHAVGLVATGRNSAALFGDATLHNEFADPGEVMSPAIGFDAMIALPFAFRDLNFAYLRQEVLLR